MKQCICHLPPLFTIVLYASLLNAQSPSFVWDARWGNALYDPPANLAIDSSGHLYTTGSFLGTVDFNPGPDTMSLTSASGAEDTYLIKFGADGAFLWVKQLSATGILVSVDILYDPAGFIYLAGFYRGQGDFDPGMDSYFLSTANDAYDIYVLKLDLNGDFIWARSIGGDGSEQPVEIALDDNGNIAIGGQFTGISDFDPGPEQLLLNATSQGDGFVATYTPDGNLISAQQFAGDGLFSATCIDIDAAGNTYIAGYFHGNYDFDPGQEMVMVQSTGMDDVFVVKLSAAGSFSWLRHLGNVFDNKIFDIAVNNEGFLHATGYFKGSLDFDPGPDDLDLFAFNSDVFVWKLNPNGELIWIAQTVGFRYDQGTAIRLDHQGSVYTSGYYGEQADFDPGPGEYFIHSTGISGSNDAFVFKVKKNGAFAWAYTLGGNSHDFGGEVLVDGQGALYITGAFQEIAGFNPGMGDADSLVSAGGFDVFLTKWDQCLEGTAEIVPIECDFYVSPSGLYTWDTSGVYTDTLVTAAGCDSIITINLQIVDLNTSVSIMDTLLVSGQETGDYQWLDCDNGFAAIPGATQKSYAPLVSGSYAVIVGEHGCADTSACTQIMLVGLEGTPNDPTPDIYPNPCHDIWYVSLHQNFADVQIQITDLSGRMVYTTQAKEIRIIPVEMIVPAGVYVVKVIYDGKMHILKSVRS